MVHAVQVDAGVPTKVSAIRGGTIVGKIRMEYGHQRR
jgi:hypothetical protein